MKLTELTNPTTFMVVFWRCWIIYANAESAKWRALRAHMPNVNLVPRAFPGEEVGPTYLTCPMCLNFYLISKTNQWNLAGMWINLPRIQMIYFRINTLIKPSQACSKPSTAPEIATNKFKWPAMMINDEIFAHARTTFSGLKHVLFVRILRRSNNFSNKSYP